MSLKIVKIICVLVSAFLGIVIYPIERNVRECVDGGFFSMIFTLFLLYIIFIALISIIYKILLKILKKSEEYDEVFVFILDGIFMLGIFVYAIYYHCAVSQWNIISSIFVAFIKILPVIIFTMPKGYDTEKKPKKKRIRAISYDFFGTTHTTYKDKDTGDEVKIDHWKF